MIKLRNDYIQEVFKEFEKISGLKVKLDFLDNYRPFKNAFFTTEDKKDNHKQFFFAGSWFRL